MLPTLQSNNSPENNPVIIPAICPRVYPAATTRIEELSEKDISDRILEQAASLNDTNRATVSEQLNSSLSSKNKVASILNQISKLSKEDQIAMKEQLDAISSRYY